MNTARDLSVRLQDLLRREHGAMAEFLVELAEFDRQRAWIELGYGSLFDFLTRELGLSKASASFRKKAAELIQRFPAAVEPLRDGRLCLSSVFEVAKVLTPENADEVLPRFFQLGKREARAVAVALRPEEAPPMRAMVTPVARSASLRPAPPAQDDAFSLPVVWPAKLPDARLGAQPEPVPVPPPPPSPTAEPLTADLSRFHVTVSKRFLEKLAAATDALSHSHRGATPDEVLEAGLDLLLERDAKRKGLVKKPRREPPPSSDPDHVPAHVRRAVWTRDGGKCQWPLVTGGVCGSTVRVEIDHRVAKARGGPPTVENLRCLCRTHNQLAAREAFGDAWMDRYTRNPRAPAAAGP